MADERTGDGAGIMTEIPYELFGVEPGQTAVGTLFIDRPPAHQDEAFDTYREALAVHGLEIVDRRSVPIDVEVLGRQARQALPGIVQIFVARPDYCRTEASFSALLAAAKRSALTRLANAGLERSVFTVSLSPRTIVYKALTRSHDLEPFYADLADPRYRTTFALFHRRFSTNTTTSWDKAQPFSMVAHNGEINTIECNRAWAVSREQALGLPRGELLTRGSISDSGSFNEMVEALRFRSSIPYLPEVLAIMVPPARAQSNAFYKFWSRAVEPWDGPAFLAFSDGRVVGARLDRNGFRPGRWARTKDAFYLASEAGIFGLDDESIVDRGALQGGHGAHVDLLTGEVQFRDPSQSRENFDATFDPRLERIAAVEPGFDRDVLEDLRLFRYNREEVDEFIAPMVATGKEPIGSMGDTARVAALSQEPRSFFDYFFQNFAQVTNPPLDHLRERLVTDLTCYLGRRPNVFAPKTLIPLTPGLELASPVVKPEELAWIRRLGEKRGHEWRFESVEIDMIFHRVRGPDGLRFALDDLATKTLQAIDGGCSIIILTDRRAKPHCPPIPSLLALQSAARMLTDHGHRLDASLVVETADARTTHDVAALVGFGAAAVCPYMAFEIARRHSLPRAKDLTPQERVANLQRAYDEGLLKIMSKVGISTAQGYHNSRLFTPLGLSADLLDAYFPTRPCLVGGIGLEAIGRAILDQTEESVVRSEGRLPNLHLLREHRKGAEGERHGMTVELSRAIHDFCGDHTRELQRLESYDAYLETCRKSGATHLRDLWDLAPAGEPRSLADVESSEVLFPRFGSGAMSFGAISAESQRDIIHGMRRIGGRSSSGEGGENPYYFEDGTTASVKQIASGRFGVTAEYLAVAEEVEIKVAQGAKPGEGGQLMGVKVDADIARARHASIGVDLISPPPLHDIYSIEDLRELIYQLKQIRPKMAVSVKLVSGAHVGTIAAGVVKAGADVVQVSGGDGGTGAASISSMRHAGLPWEVGLADVHQTLVTEGLRERVIVRVDGGLRHGEDVVKAACLGADQFGFGKLILIAEGCIMARVCQKNTCPRGIATHDPKFKAKYRGSADDVVALFDYLAHDVRRWLARLGVSRFEQLVGRGDLLIPAEAHRGLAELRGLDLSKLAVRAPRKASPLRPQPDDVVNELNRRIVDDLERADQEASLELDYAIRSTDRGILATAAGASVMRKGAGPSKARIRFHGSAGQGFAAFLSGGFDVLLEGEANDSVAKSMSGGRLVVRPPKTRSYDAESNTIIGNAALYGATAGEVFILGRAGDRFAVRNSGATAVVEGAGLHACEYMTNGTVVILGDVSFNVGAGMTGGRLYMPRSFESLANAEYIVGRDLGPEETHELRALLERHVQLTGSRTARRLLDGSSSTVMRVFEPLAQRLEIRKVS